MSQGTVMILAQNRQEKDFTVATPEEFVHRFGGTRVINKVKYSIQHSEQPKTQRENCKASTNVKYPLNVLWMFFEYPLNIFWICCPVILNSFIWDFI